MRKNLAAALVCVLALLCLNPLSAPAEEKSFPDIIALEISDEAKQYEAEIAGDGAKLLLSEEYFDYALEYLAGREGQEIPSYETQSRAGSFALGEYDVYTLENEGWENIVLYIHGGAWMFEISEDHVKFCDLLAARLNAKVYMPLYPLAPQATCEAAYAMIEELYKQLSAEGRRVYIMGDSAGGNIALGLMYAIKADNLTLPDKLVLLAPCPDMTFSNPDMVPIDGTVAGDGISNAAARRLNLVDPELNLYGCRRCAVLWAGEEKLTTPKNSAMYADVSGYPDTLIFQGTKDLLYPDNILFYKKLCSAGVKTVFVQGIGLWHVFPIYPIPERETALALIAEFCAE